MNFPRDQGLTIKEQLEVAGKTKGELWELCFKYIKENLAEFANNVVTQNNYVIRYWIPEDIVSSTVMPSDNWQEQLPTANQCITLFNNPSHSQWEYSLDVVANNLTYCFEYDLLPEITKKFEQLKDDVIELSGLWGKAWREKWSNDLDNMGFRSLLHKYDVLITLTVLEDVGELRSELKGYEEQFKDGVIG